MRHILVLGIFNFALLFSFGLSTNVFASEPVEKGDPAVRSKLCRKLLGNRPEVLTALDSLKTNMSKDFTTASRLAQISAEMADSRSKKSAIQIGANLEAARAEILPLFKLGENEREAAIRAMESELRIGSYFTRLALAEASAKKESINYDLLILGTGVHGVVAGLAALNKNPNLRVLFVDSTDTAASNFRYPGNTAALNSSNRASYRNRLPLPGGGNLNEIPLAPVQVADFSAEKYSTFGDLGATMISALYSLVKKYPHVDVAFNTQANSIKPFGTLDRMNLFLPEKSDKNGVNVDAKATIVATGLGKPKYPEGIKNDKRLKKWRQQKLDVDGTVNLPKISTVSEALTLANRSENPASLFAGKKIAIVGDGDSAATLIEFLLGFGPREGYGQSGAQNGIPKKIYWIGVDRSCRDFINSNRSRYLRLASSFPNLRQLGVYERPKPFADLLEGIPKRLFYVEPDRNKRLFIVVDRGPGQNENFSADNLILATGFEDSIPELLKNYDNPSKYNSPDFLRRFGVLGDDWLRQFDFVGGSTSTSGGKVTRIAREIRSNAVGVQVAIVGPPAGDLPSKDELVGVFQNTVSIFNIAPRTRATAEMIAQSIEASHEIPRFRPQIAMDNRTYDFTYNFNYSIRSLGRSDEAFLVSTVDSAFQFFDVRSSAATGALKISFWRDDSGILRSQTQGFDSKLIMRALAASRDFIPTIANLVKRSSGLDALSFVIQLNGINSDQTSLTTISVDSNKPTLGYDAPVEIRNLEPLATDSH